MAQAKGRCPVAHWLAHAFQRRARLAGVLRLEVGELVVEELAFSSHERNERTVEVDELGPIASPVERSRFGQALEGLRHERSLHRVELVSGLAIGQVPFGVAEVPGEMIRTAEHVAGSAGQVPVSGRASTVVEHLPASVDDFGSRIEAERQRQYGVVAQVHDIERSWASSDTPNQSGLHTCHQNTLAHEFGHYLGLSHTCAAGGGLNSSAQYCEGGTMEQLDSLMAIGNDIRPAHAWPWRHRLPRHHYLTQYSWRGRTSAPPRHER